jgi:hypothetical protein
MASFNASISSNICCVVREIWFITLFSFSILNYFHYIVFIQHSNTEGSCCSLGKMNRYSKLVLQVCIDGCLSPFNYDVPIVIINLYYHHFL